jgi:pimeloyl-ACP methyl ester carboxylesterase
MPKRSFSPLWGAALCLVFGLTPSNAAQVAARIEYETVARPADLPNDFQPLPGTSLKFLSIKTIDGFVVKAALWQPEAKAPAETTLIIMVHGSGGSYTRAPNSTLSRSLSGNGFAALAINTRQHDDKRNTDNFFDISRDIDASVQTARALGYRSIVLQGHSLGTIQVLFYAATNWEHDIKAVVQLSAIADLPWRSRYLQIQDEDKFRALSDAALKLLHEGKEREVMALRMRRTGAEEEPLTGEHFLTNRAEASSSANGTYWIKRVPRPILMVRDAGDTIITPFEPYVLLSAATSPGSLVQADQADQADQAELAHRGDDLPARREPDAMIDLRSMIIERIKTRGPSAVWILDTYLHLLNSGIAPDDAMEAMSLFVDEVIAKKRSPHLKVVK